MNQMANTQRGSGSAYDYAMARIREARRAQASPMPTWLAQLREKYKQQMLSRAEHSFTETGVWFLSRGAARGTDEMETKAVWGDLLTFCALEELPGYSEENHKQAIAFWQSWQNQSTGQLFNPLYQDPQSPETERQTTGNRPGYRPERINLKYVQQILRLLGSDLLVPLPAIETQTRADRGEDVFDHLWEAIALRRASHAGAYPVSAVEDLHAGHTDRLPQIEAGMTALVRGFSRETGMWRSEPLEGFPWHAYLPSSGFKILARLCGYLGLENFPRSILTTAIDQLLTHQHELYDTPATARNYAETLAHYLMMSDYRRAELLEVMELCLKGFQDPALWASSDTSVYCYFGSGMIGAFLHWSDLPLDEAMPEWKRFEQGANLKYRFITDPFGHWVNVIPREDLEPTLDRQSGRGLPSLLARNQEHGRRRVVQLVAEQEVRVESDGLATIILALDDAQCAALQQPHLTARWCGAFDVTLNGVLVKRVRYNQVDVSAGWLLPPDAVRTLKPGQNVVEARNTGPGRWPTPGAPEATVSPTFQAGLMDWRTSGT